MTNPFNAAQARRVSLKPGDVGLLVFWTRDPRAILDARAALDPYPFYVMTTLTAYPRVLEPNMPPHEEIAEAMAALVKTQGCRVIWRYDPVFLCSLTDRAFHIKNFAAIASRLSGHVDRVIISIYDEYRGARRRLSALEQEGRFRILPHYTDEGFLLPEVKQLVAELAAVAASFGMEMRSCAEKEDLADLGVKAGACIDKDLVREILGASSFDLRGRDKNQRSHCRCIPSVDIGSYGPCPAGCAYCYARR